MCMQEGGTSISGIVGVGRTRLRRAVASRSRMDGDRLCFRRVRYP